MGKEQSDDPNVPVYTLKPRHFYGLTNLCSGSLQFLSDTKIMYPIGKTLVFEDLVTRRQRYLNLSKPDRIIKEIVLSPDRRFLAVSESSSNKPIITIYSTISLKQMKYLNNPVKNCTATEFAALSFMCDNRQIAALIGEPDWIMLIYDWERGVANTETKAHVGKTKPAINQIVCHPSDPRKITLIGDEVFRMMHFTDKNWIQYGYRRTETTHVTCACWISQSHLLVGTKHGKLLAIENGMLKKVYNAALVIEIDLKTIADKIEHGIFGHVTDSSHSEVGHLVSFEHGFAYTCLAGTITVFEKVKKTSKNIKWTRRGIFLAEGPNVGKLDKENIDLIQQIAVSQDEKTIICTTLRNEIFHGELKNPNTWKDSSSVLMETHFNGMHNGPISSVSSSMWKSFFITAGRIDRTLTLWDFKTRKIKFRKEFEEDILSAAIHPSGFYCLVGFTTRIKLMIIFVDDFRPMKEILIPNCPIVEYSWGGHIFAAVHGLDVNIYSSVTLECIQIIKGNTKEILSIKFLKNDFVLYICGEKGSMFKWDLKRESRDLDIEKSNIGIYDVAHAKQLDSEYFINFEGQIKELVDSKASRAFKMREWELRRLVISNSETMMLAAGLNGSILAIKFPIGEPIGYTEYSMHSSPITQIVVTQNDQTLISVSEDGALCIWRIVFPESSRPEVPEGFTFLTETMVTYEDWADNKKKLNDLRAKLKENDEENEYIMKQMMANNSNSLKEIQHGYNATIADLENKIKMLEKSHVKETELYNLAMLEESNKNAEKIEKQRKRFQSKLEQENTKTQNMVLTTKTYIQNYHAKIKVFDEVCKKSMEDLDKEKETFILELMKKNYCLRRKINEKKTSMKEMKTQIDDDYQNEMQDMNTDFNFKMASQERITENLLAQRKIVVRKNMRLNKRLKKYRDDFTRSNLGNKKLEKMIKKQENQIQKMRNEVDTKMAQIKKTEITIVKTVRSQRDFLKEKFVRDVRIETLKEKFEPLEDKIQRYTNLDNELEKVLENKDRMINRTKKMVAQLSKHCASLNAELKLQNDIRYETEQLIEKLKFEICSCIQAAGDPKQLKGTLLELVNRYVSVRLRGGDDKFDPTTSAEFMRQRRHLEASAKNLRSLISRKPRIVVKYKRTNAQAVQNHIANLISDIKSLRGCWRSARRKVQLFEKIVGIGSDQNTYLSDKFEKMTKRPEELEKEALVELWGYYVTLRVLITEIERLSGQPILEYLKGIKGKIAHLVHSRAKKSDKKKKANLIEKVIRHVMSDQSLASEKSQKSLGGWNPTQRIK